MRVTINIVHENLTYAPSWNSRTFLRHKIERFYVKSFNRYSPTFYVKSKNFCAFETPRLRGQLGQRLEINWKPEAASKNTTNHRNMLGALSFVFVCFVSCSAADFPGI